MDDSSSATVVSARVSALEGNRILLKRKLVVSTNMRYQRFVLLGVSHNYICTPVGSIHALA